MVLIAIETPLAILLFLLVEAYIVNTSLCAQGTPNQRSRQLHYLAYRVTWAPLANTCTAVTS
jgi:hypothetical protein